MIEYVAGIRDHLDSIKFAASIAEITIVHPNLVIVNDDLNTSLNENQPWRSLISRLVREVSS